MPNYIKNILTLEGSLSESDRLLSAIQGKNGPMDFQKIIPMPSELDIESGSRTDRGLGRFSRFVVETGGLPQREADYLAAHPEIEKEEWELGKQAYRNIQKYGSPTWYQWRIQHWGTKWNASSVEITDGQLSFLTAWNAPKPVLEKLSQMFPSLTLHHVWADEDIGHNCGERTYQNGIVTQETLPTGHDAVEFACDLWNISPDEYLGEEPEMQLY